jgi:hypothetical protein
MRMVNVVNATMSRIITITEEDISRGEKRDPAGCAAAISCCRLPRVAEARVHTSTTYLRERPGKKWLRYRTPSALKYGMIAFDRGGTLEAGEYILRPIQPSHQARGERQGTPGTGVKPKTTRPRHTLLGVRPHAPRGFSDG